MTLYFTEVSYIQRAKNNCEADTENPIPGCGRFFEGTAEEMHTALNKSLASVPDDTKVYVSSSKASLKHSFAELQARTRVHESQRQIRHLSLAKRTIE